MVRNFFVFTATLTLSGCIGFTTGFSTQTISYDGCKGTKRCNEALGTYNFTAASIKKSDVLATLGPPDSKSVSGNIETWDYEHDLAWRGIVLYAFIIPIPLLAPTGYNHWEYKFEDDSLAKATRDLGVDNHDYILCLPIPIQITWELCHIQKK